MNKGMRYTLDNSGLIIMVHKVHYKGDRYIKFKGSIFSRSGKYLIEGFKNYKVDIRRFKQWRVDARFND